MLGKEGNIPNLIKGIYESPITLNDEKHNFFTVPEC